ncbi:MAG TPA: hypothetical protein VFB80_11570, partial [Pirellulaceae bacterium]|nr:hypothetical protein [Pirellulaceae bacterium]
MLRTSFHRALAAAVLLLLPAPLLAGGPPFLCLPLEGVTAANARACTDLLDSRLASKFNQAGWPRGVKVLERTGQWYAAFYMGSDVRLADVTAALKGSQFSVPQDKLHFFGHVILEIDPQKASPKALLADLEAMNFVSVDESKAGKDLLLVTVDMPYPAENGSLKLESVGWDTFHRSDLASDQATRSESPASAKQLPSYGQIRDVVSK